ncbi:hypothetical protein BCO71033_03058 [Burkholderia contaminans]|uniref:Uncharacterized protein n=1 Tax=Burkholderia contaminans TaxID=488447 RepID=A0A6P2YK46_9BURK|nr:hypothetical protein BCO71033_03058 [Burkholderia contaminans]
MMGAPEVLSKVRAKVTCPIHLEASFCRRESKIRLGGGMQLFSI